MLSGFKDQNESINWVQLSKWIICGSWREGKRLIWFDKAFYRHIAIDIFFLFSLSFQNSLAYNFLFSFFIILSYFRH